MHGIAFNCIKKIHSRDAFVPCYGSHSWGKAVASKPTHKAGRRSGDSIARKGCKHVRAGCAYCTEAGASDGASRDVAKRQSLAKRI